MTLGCARNEVDSEELAARLTASGWDLTSADEASVVLVNTCGFIQAAKQESIDELLSAAESGAKVAAVGCLAERYGAELAGELPEAQILSFDDYGDIGARLDDVLAGRRRPAHTARDRRTLLDKMLALLGIVAIAQPCYFVADAYYAARKIVAGLLKENNHLVTRVKSNAVAYTAHQQRGPRKRGRPRVYGRKVRLNSLLEDTKGLQQVPRDSKVDRSATRRLAGLVGRRVGVAHP